MHRRTCISGVVSATLLGLSGCAGDSNDSYTEDDMTTNSSPTASPTPTRQQEVLIDETIHTRNRYPFDFQAGQQLVITADVKRGGPLVVDVANTDTAESIFSDTVKTQDEFEIPIENDGTHYVTFQGASEANIRVVIAETIE